MFISSDYSDDQNIDNLYLINADGTKLVNLTNFDKRKDISRLTIDSALWSPNGKVIAFSTLQDFTELYILSPNDGHLISLSSNGFQDASFSWSPDGTKLVTECVKDNDWNTCIVNVDGTGRKIISDLNGVPYWSPDGQNIAISGTESDIDTATLSIIVMNPDGTNARKISNILGNSLHLAWSPDGKKIAFRAGKYDSNSNAIFVVNVDGSGETQLTEYETLNDLPVWSPDGREIVFISKRDGKWEVYSMNADGTNQTRLTKIEMDAYGPNWSPDGKRIAFTLSDAKTDQIFIINADGSGLSQLTWINKSKSNVEWQPQDNP